MSTSNSISAYLQSGAADFLQVRGSTNVKDGAWHHVAAVYRGTSVCSGFSLYVDGATENQSCIDETVSATIQNAVALRLGTRDGNGVPFNGNIDDARIYNRALSASEVKQLYNLGR